MSNLLDTLTTELRITGRLFRETFLGLKRTGWMNLVIVITMASILSIFGVVMAIVIETGVLVRTLGTELEISAYVKEGIDPLAVRNKLLTLPHVRKITVVSKEKAWFDMQQEYPMPDIENPLPDTIHVQMANESFIPETVQKMREYPEITLVQYAKKVLDKIRGITRGTSLVGILVSIFLGALTLFIISNTIHLLIEAKSREIEILRMMGVGNWYIRLPFLLQGGLYGLVGAAIAYLPMSIAVYYLNILFDYLGFQANDLTTAYVLIVLFLMGILVGAGGAAMAVRKYLHV